MLAEAAIARRIALVAPLGRDAVRAAPYAIGTLAGFWFVGRVAAFLV